MFVFNYVFFMYYTFNFTCRSNFFTNGIVLEVWEFMCFYFVSSGVFVVVVVQNKSISMESKLQRESQRVKYFWN